MACRLAVEAVLQVMGIFSSRMVSTRRRAARAPASKAVLMEVDAVVDAATVEEGAAGVVVVSIRVAGTQEVNHETKAT